MAPGRSAEVLLTAQPLGPKRLEMAVSAARRLVIGVVARGMSTDMQLSSAPASCLEAWSSAAGSGLLPVVSALDPRSGLMPDR